VSKAFTKETDDAPGAPARRRGIAVPDPNYVTPAGLVALRAELDELTRGHRDPDRVRELSEHLATAIPLPPADRGKVGLGATVTVETESGARVRYTIVGAIEACPKSGAISWQSPIANALWDAVVGDAVALPRGDIEIVAIDYD
jgi:transcription elongation GreA/GreB family factor